MRWQLSQEWLVIVTGFWYTYGMMDVRRYRIMGRTPAVGIQSFEEIRTGNCFYVDKTDFIKEWWESRDSVTLITRPRRFGKTLNMSMVESFFSVDYADRGDLFEGLSVWEKEKYRKIQGTYPVIALSFARVKEASYQDTKDKMVDIIRDIFIKNIFIRDSAVMTDTDREFFDRILKVGACSNTDMTSSLHKLSDYLFRYYGKKVIILLDEYDTPMQEAYVNGFWDELVAFTRSLFNSTFKTNPYLERGIMTGITRISKESIFSDLNNLEVITTTSKKYETAFGFTEDEVLAALSEFGLSDKMDEVRYWYDGFVFGNHKDIYNPWSIINLLGKKECLDYWASSSSNALISKLLREGNRDIKESFEILIKDGTIKSKLDEHIVYSQLYANEAAVWSLLLAGGYLKVVGREKEYESECEYEDVESIYELKITNFETKRMFESMVRGWFSMVYVEYNGFIKAMLADDKKAMNAYMNRVTMGTFSFFDTGRGVRGDEPERFYHGFVLGLLAELKRNYIITSNRESGFGRYDVVIEPKKPQDNNAYILEFKLHDSEDEETLMDTVAVALKQIEDKKYATDLIRRGIPKEKIRCYGFAFKGKEVLIG